MNLTITDLSLLVLAGFAAGTYAKSEGASSLLAAVVGVIVPIVIYLIAK